MDDYIRSLAESVRKARKRKGLTQVQLAELVRADPRTILNIENCNDNPKLDTLANIIRFLSLDPRLIFYPESKNDSPNHKAMELLLQNCSEEEAQVLLPICQCVLESIRSVKKCSAI